MSLESDVLGPLDESGQVLLGGEITTDTEGLGLLLEKGVLGGLGDLFGAVRGGCGLRFSFCGLGLRVIESAMYSICFE